MQKLTGRAAFGATVLIRYDDAGDAPLYADAGGLIRINNPLTVGPSDAWEAYAPQGVYAITTNEAGRNVRTQELVLHVDAQRPNSLAPDVIAHRGGSYVAPENSLSAYRAAQAAGLMNIEQDIQLLADGALGVMHDSTVDRTTNGTGDCGTFTAATWKALSMDASAWFAPPWVAEAPPLFGEVCREFGNRLVLWPEAKDAAAGSALVATLLRNGITPAGAVVCGFDRAALAPAIRAGYRTLCAHSGGASEADLDADRAAGVWAAASGTWLPERVAYAKKIGLIVVAYTHQRRSTWKSLKAMGVDIIYSDDPLWVAGLTTPMNVDSFSAQTWSPGMLPGYSTVRGSFVAPNVLRLPQGGSSGAGTYYSVLMGGMCPIKGDEACRSFTLTGELAIGSVISTTRHADIAVCCSDDGAFDDNSNLGKGYNILVRANGTVDIYRVTPGASAVNVGTVAGAALTLGQFYPWTITVTEGSVSITVNGVTATANDAVHRGGYFHLGGAGAQVDYRNIAWS